MRSRVFVCVLLLLVTPQWATGASLFKKASNPADKYRVSDAADEPEPAVTPNRATNTEVKAPAAPVADRSASKKTKEQVKSGAKEFPSSATPRKALVDFVKASIVEKEITPVFYDLAMKLPVYKTTHQTAEEFVLSALELVGKVEQGHKTMQENGSFAASQFRQDVKKWFESNKGSTKAEAPRSADVRNYYFNTVINTAMAMCGVKTDNDRGLLMVYNFLVRTDKGTMWGTPEKSFARMKDFAGALIKRFDWCNNPNLDEDKLRAYFARPKPAQ